VHPGRRYSALGQHFGHQGLWLDAEAGQYQNRARWYGPSVRRFGPRDPLLSRGESGAGYQDGLSLYSRLQSNPLSGGDPLGLCTSEICGSIVVTKVRSCSVITIHSRRGDCPGDMAIKSGVCEVINGSENDRLKTSWSCPGNTGICECRGRDVSNNTNHTETFRITSSVCWDTSWGYPGLVDCDDEGARWCEVTVTVKVRVDIGSDGFLGTCERCWGGP
jgi:RHS repeat-associated protein